MAYPPDEKCRPRISLVEGEWYAYAPNNSPMARALLVPAISFVRSQNERLRAKTCKAARAPSTTQPADDAAVER